MKCFQRNHYLHCKTDVYSRETNEQTNEIEPFKSIPSRMSSCLTDAGRSSCYKSDRAKSKCVQIVKWILRGGPLNRIPERLRARNRNGALSPHADQTKRQSVEGRGEKSVSGDKGIHDETVRETNRENGEKRTQPRTAKGGRVGRGGIKDVQAKTRL